MRHLELFPYAPIESASPVLDGDVIYASSARGAAVYALRASDGTPIWTFHAGGRIEATPVVGGGKLFIADAKGRVHCVDLEDGAERWQTEIAGVSTARLLYDKDADGERVIVPTGDNKLHALDAATGNELWTYRREPPADLTVYGTASPVKVTTANGPLYVAGFSDGYLVAIKPSNGTSQWEAKLVSGGRFRDVDGAVVQSGDFLYAAAFNDDLFQLDAATGKIRWASAPGGATGIAFGGGKLVHGVETGDVLARDPADGRELWRWHLPAGVPTTPVISGDYVFVASSSRAFYALRLDNGSVAWSFDPGYQVSGSWAAPVVEGGRVWFTSNVGTVYCFRPAGADVHFIGSWDPTEHP